MSAEIELLGLTTVGDADWQQPLDELIDVSSYKDAAIIVTAYSVTHESDPCVVSLSTSIDNDEARFGKYAEIAKWTDDVSSPESQFAYLPGVDANGDDKGGFAKYLRVVVSQNAAGSITFDVKAILRM